MQVIGNNTATLKQFLGALPQVPNPCVATIGSFDGVHQGHRFVIEQVVSQARRRGLDSMVVTFPNHPLQVLRTDFRPQMLTLPNEKVERLQETGVEKVALIEFTKELAQMSAREFMHLVLKEQLGVEVLVMGYDNRFGNGQTSFEECARLGKEMGIEVIATPPMAEARTWGNAPKNCFKSHTVSSTAVREALSRGDIETANSILGYHYSLGGEVVEGFQNGRRLGYPTANLKVDPQKLIPENGVYIVKVRCGDDCRRKTLDDRFKTEEGERKTLDDRLKRKDDNPQSTVLNLQSIVYSPQSTVYSPPAKVLYGMLNIGTRPTLHNGSERSIEVHLFDFDGDLYGQTLQIELLHHLRREQEFSSLDALRQQLAEDEQACRRRIEELKD